MRRNFALVFNQSAGAGRPRKLDRVVTHLERRGARVTALQTSSAADASVKVATVARSGTYDAVIAAGGDGTIRAVAAGAAGTSLAVGIVPLGTGNVMRHEIGLSTRARLIAHTLLEGPEIPVRGGVVNGAPFFLMAGAGFDGRIVALLNQKSKRLFGRLASALVMLALLLWRSTLNIFSMIGLVMLMGLVTKNAILLVDFANQARKAGATVADALLQAGLIRLRPIMMTTAAMVFGMLPLALALNEGGEIQAPMGRAIIGGVITSTLLTLVVVPVIYSLLVRDKRAVASAGGGSAMPVPADRD